VPVNDQSASGVLDIGNTRIQWGYDNQAISTVRNIALPAAFANTSYSVTITADGDTGAVSFPPRVGAVGGKTTTRFQAQMATATDAASTMSFSWQAIGRKP
jgi:hypothetical protein